MLENPDTHGLVRAGRTARLAVALFVLAEVIRTLTDQDTQIRLAWYAGLMAAYVLLFLFTLLSPRLPPWTCHVYLTFQSALVLAMLALDPKVDAITGFFVPLAFQVPLFFAGNSRWLWVAILALLTAGSLVLPLGILEGLALAMTPLAGVIGLPALLIAHQETEIAGTRARVMVEELTRTNQQLKSFAEQVEELAALRERNRLARNLHDTVSQHIFSIVLTSRSAELLLPQGAPQAREQLEHLQELTSDALRQLRSFISQMRP